MSASMQSRDRVQTLLTHHCSVQVLDFSEYSVQALMVSVALYCLLCIVLQHSNIIMAGMHSRCGHFIFILWFLLLSFSSSPNLSLRRLDVYHTSTHDVALVQISNAGLKCAACGSLKIQDAKKSPKIRHLGTIAQLCRVVSSQLRHVSTIGKNVLSSNIFSTCPQNMADSGPLTAEIGLGVWGTTANFNGFRVLASLLQRHRSPEANQTFARCLAVSWAATYIFGGSCPRKEFCQVQNSRYFEVLHSPTLAALLHRTPAAGVSATLRHGACKAVTGLATFSARIVIYLMLIRRAGT